MEANTSDRVLEFIQSQCGTALAREQSLDDIGIDSLELLDLQIECEKKFGKHLPDEMQSKILTVGDLADFYS